MSWRKQNELEIVENLQGQGFNSEEIISALKYRRAKLEHERKVREARIERERKLEQYKLQQTSVTDPLTGNDRKFVPTTLENGDIVWAELNEDFTTTRIIDPMLISRLDKVDPEVTNKYKDASFKVNNGKWRIDNGDGTFTDLDETKDIAVIEGLDASYPLAKQHASNREDGTTKRSFTYNVLGSENAIKRQDAYEEYEDRNKVTFEEWKEEKIPNVRAYFDDILEGHGGWGYATESFFNSVFSTSYETRYKNFLENDNSVLKDEYLTWKDGGNIENLYTQEVINPNSFTLADPSDAKLFSQQKTTDMINSIPGGGISADEFQEGYYSNNPNLVPPIEKEHGGYVLTPKIIKQLEAKGIKVENATITQEQYQELLSNWNNNMYNSLDTETNMYKTDESAFDKSNRIANISQYYGERVSITQQIAEQEGFYNKEDFKVGKYILNGEEHNITQNDLVDWNQYRGDAYDWDNELHDLQLETTQKQEDIQNEYEILSRHKTRQLVSWQMKHNPSSLFYSATDLEGVVDDMDDFNEFIRGKMNNELSQENIEVSTSIYNPIQGVMKHGFFDRDAWSNYMSVDGLKFNTDGDRLWRYDSGFRTSNKSRKNRTRSDMILDGQLGNILAEYINLQNEELESEYNKVEKAGITDLYASINNTSVIVKSLSLEYENRKKDYLETKEKLDNGTLEKTQENIEAFDKMGVDLQVVGDKLNNEVNKYNRITNNPYNINLINSYEEVINDSEELQLSSIDLFEKSNGSVVRGDLQDSIAKHERASSRDGFWWTTWDAIETVPSWLLGSGGSAMGTVFIEGRDLVGGLFGSPMDPKKKAQAYNHFAQHKKFYTPNTVDRGSLVNPDGSVNWAAAPSQVANTLGEMYMMVVGGGGVKSGINLGVKGVKKGLKLSPFSVNLGPKLSRLKNGIGKTFDKYQIGSRFSYSLGAAAVYHPMHVQEAMEQISEDFTYTDAFAAAEEKTYWTSLIEAINPDYKLFNGYKRLTKSKSWKNYKNWTNGVNARKLWDGFSRQLAQVPAEILEENLQEFMNGRVSAAYNKSHGTEFALPTAEDYKALNILTPIATIIAGGIRTNAFKNGDPGIYKEALENYEEFSETMYQHLKNNKITQEEFDTAMVNLEYYTVAKNNIPVEEYAEMSDRQRSDTLGLLVQKAKIEEQIKREKDPVVIKRLKSDLKRTDKAINKSSISIQSEIKSKKESKAQYEIDMLKIQWKQAERGSQQRSDLKEKIAGKIKERNEAREAAPKFEFNGKGYNNALEFIKALETARDNGFFTKRQKAGIKINNKVGSDLAAYVSKKAAEITGKANFNSGDVVMDKHNTIEAIEFANKVENRGSSLQDYRDRYKQELLKKKPDTNLLNELRNVIKFEELYNRGYRLNQQARGMVMEGVNTEVENITQRRIAEKFNAVNEIAGKAGVNMIPLSRDQIADYISRGIIENPDALNANAFIMPQLNEETGKYEQTIVINRDIALKNKAFTAPSHELLHAILFKVLNGPLRTVTKNGVKYDTYLTEEGAELIRGFINLLPADQVATIENNMFVRGYFTKNENGEIIEPFETYAEEFLTAYHDLVVEGNLQNRPETRSILRKIKDYFINFFKKEMPEDLHGLIDTNLDNPEKLLEFIRTFNNQSIKEKYSKEIMDMAVSSQEYYGEVIVDQADAVTSFSRAEQNVDQKITEEQREKLVKRVNEIYADPKTTIDQKAGLIAQEYRGMAEVRFEVAVETAPSQQIRDILINNKEDVIAQMLYDPGDGKNKARNVLGLVRDFEIEKQKYKNIAAYINKYFRVRAYEAISKVTKDKMFKKQFEDSQSELQETEAQETSLNEETQFINNQIVITDKLTQVDPYNELLKQQVKDYNDYVNDQVDQNQDLTVGKTYKSLKDLNPLKTIERMTGDQVVNGQYSMVYVDNGAPYWKTPKGKKQLGTSIVEGIFKKLTNNDNLNQQDIKALQPYISKHASMLRIGLPEGFTTDKNNTPQKATGVQKVLLEPFYNKGKRVGNIYPQRKKPNIGDAEFLDVFGITPRGEINIVGKESNVSQRIKALIEQHGRATTNQQARKRLLEKGVDSEVVGNIANGKSKLIFSLGSNSDFNPNTQQVEPGFSFSEAQYVNELIRTYFKNPSLYRVMKEFDPVMAQVVEDVFILPNPNLTQGEKYIASVILDKYTPEEFKRDNFKGKSYIGPKLFDSKQPNKIGEYQEQYIQEALAFAQTIHPAFDYKTLKFLLGFKSGKTIDIRNHSELLSVTKEGKEDVINEIKYRQFNGDLELEETMLRENGINPDIFSDIQNMVNSGRVQKILTDITSQPSLEAKRNKLEEYKQELSEFNEANDNAMKYLALKLRQAYHSNLVSPHFVYFNGQIQTNIIEGTRSLSTFEYMYLLEGQQLPLKPDGSVFNKPAKKKGETNLEYYTSQRWIDYVNAAKKMDEWSERETVNRKQLKEKGKVKLGIKSIPIAETITDKTLDLETAVAIATLADLSWKNEHIGASATTHAERTSYVFSDGKSVDLSKFGHDHRTAWVPTYLADKYFDAKIKIGNKEVDNKVSYEGPMRMTKFGKGKHTSIYHFNNELLSDYLNKVEDIPSVVANIRRLTDAQAKDDKTITKAVMMSRGIDENTPVRGMSAFDFDETLIDKGENTITATKGEDVVTITSGQWPLQGPKYAKLGYEFDFSDFINVRGGVEGPLMQKFRNRIEKYGIENNYILTARPAESAPAIKSWLEQQGIDMPIENITGLGNSTGEAKALWIANKFAEGYNDIYFVDDALPNVEAVANMLDQLDIKGSSVQAKIKFSRGMSSEFSNILQSQIDAQLDINRIIEQSKGVKAETRYSEAQAKIRGSKKGRFAFFVPPSAEDFKGLMYRLIGKGRQGERHIAFFKKALFDPFSRAITNINRSTQQVQNSYRKLLKAFPEINKNLNELVPDTNFTQQQAVRVYLWQRGGFEIPGLSQRDLNTLVNFVRNNENLKSFATQLSNMVNQPVGYTAPSEYWLAETIQSDIQTLNNEITRDQHLAEFKQNREKIFGTWKNDKLVGENINKLEAIYGTRYREALEDILFRMEYGRKREQGSNRLVNAFNNWANQSVGAIMFFNMRSALLQTISSINFINWSDNNPLKASAAFANQPQFWKDFSFIFNSDMLKQRRAGNQRGINEAELAAAIAGSKNKAKAALSWLLTKGFLPTQIADSFAISSGGATFYRNRINSYLKQGMEQSAAEVKAFSDFQEITEESQQSSRPDLISQQQASSLGRYILAFKNTPMQYARLIKKAYLDLVNNRGDFKSNLSKILYYGLVQNLIFNGLQAALGAMIGDDDEEEDNMKEWERIIHGMGDSLFSGLGIGGNVVVTIKNTIREYLKQDEKDWGSDHTYTMLKIVSFSPTVGSKLRKIYSGIQTEKFNEDVIKEMSLLDIDNPIYSVFANVISGTTNIPLDRLVKKVDNIDAAITEDISNMERLALLLGWNTWDLGVKDQDIIKIQEEIKERKKEEKKIERENKKKEKKKELEKENKTKEEDNRKLNDGGCVAISMSGERCKNKAEAGGYCTIHAKVEKGTVEKQCSKIKSNGDRCKMKTKAKSGLCYYHD